MFKYKTLAILPVLLILFSLTAFALQENFEVFSSIQNIASCANSITANSIILTNTGDVESNYVVSTAGTAQATLSENRFSLNSGESKSIFVYYGLLQKGSYSLQITAKTGFGLEKTIQQNVQIESCQNIQLSVRNPELTVNPCQPAQFIFDIRNAGSGIETYEFKTEGLNEYSALSTNSLVLNPGEASQVDLFVNAACEIYGEKRIKFQALAKSSQFLAEAKVGLNILRNYNYDIKLPNPISICNLKESKIQVAIKNDVQFTNQFDLTVRGPSWLNIEASRVELGPNGYGITNIIAAPAYPGSFVVDFISKSARGGIIKAASHNITVEKCYSPDVNIDSPSGIIVLGHSLETKITIKNDGTKKDTYNFELIAPKWTSTTLTKVVLNPKESRTFDLKFSPTNETGDFTATLRLLSEETRTVKEDKIKLSVVSPEDAFRLDIKPEHTRILYGKEVINVNLENKGILPATYDLELKSQSWAKFLSSSVTLKPGEKTVVYIQTETKKEQEADYEAQVIAKIKGENVGYVSKFDINLRQLTINQELTIFAAKYWIFLAIGAVVLLSALFIFIFGRRIARKYRNWKLRRQEIAKVKAELKARKKEEDLARKMLIASMQKHKKPRSTMARIFGVFLVLFALILLLGPLLSMTIYAPFFDEFTRVKADPKFESMIKVDTKNLDAYGNSVIIRNEETIIPILIKNNYNETLNFAVETGSSWIKSDTKSVELKPEEEQRVNLIATPDSAVKGIYNIQVTASVEKGDKIFKETVKLNIKQKSVFSDIISYGLYMLGGIIVLILGILISKLISKIKRSKRIETTGSKEIKEIKVNQESFSRLKYKPIKKFDVELRKK
ncbi:hypothetical protein J4482_01150 [Candidatus Woesearchaeota archaeon]|nr:hypothetical protein [Candidatus Woesearchaeota archaeon]